MNLRNIFQLKSKSSGFTLIELVVSIGILAVISVGVLTILNPMEQIKKANDAKRKADLAQIQRVLEGFYQDNGRYPYSTDPSDPSLCGNSNPCPNYRIVSLAADNPVRDWGTSFQPYINALPKDSNSSYSYVYYSPASSNGQTYYLYASLERGGKDPSTCYPGSNNNLKCANAPASCGGVCNYGVSSPNTNP